MLYGRGQGNPLQSIGPPRPASASNRLIITAIAASSLLSGTACSLDSLDEAVKMKFQLLKHEEKNSRFISSPLSFPTLPSDLFGKFDELP